MGFSLGARVPIERASDEDTRQFIDFLKEDGFTSFRRSKAGVAEMAIAAIKDCLAKSPVVPEDIDTVIFATESFTDTGATDPIAIRNTFLSGLAKDCGITRAAIHACWLNECANLSYALCLTHGLVASGSAQNVLAVVADRHDDRRPRLMTSGAAIMSDGSAAVLVASVGGGFRLRHVVTQFAPDVFAAERSNDVQRKTQGLMSDLAFFAGRIEAITGRSVTGYPLILTDNLHGMYLDFIREGLGVLPERLSQPSKAGAAHVFSIDGLLGLDALASSGDLPSSPIAILNIISWSFGFIVLEAT